MKEIVVVGGGTAGWLAALRMRQAFNYNITVVKSSKVGILGAGEGSTPHLIEFLDGLGISVLDLIKNTNATLKNGIDFINWKGDGASYFHGFGIFDQRLSFDGSIDLFKSVIRKEQNIDEYYLPAVLTNKYKSPFIYTNQFQFIPNDESRAFKFFENTGNRVNYSIHFDATELASYLEKIAIQRGIQVIDDLVQEIVTDDDDYIVQLNLENNGPLGCDFVFDCTGFHRLIIGKKYNSEWVSFKDNLPMKEAQPFFLPPSVNIRPCTEAIAQDAGWIWRIPLQHRYGCGYVYDSRYISNDEVKAKILELYPEAEIGKKTFKFEAGYHKKAAIKNCFAIGLSNGFVEPLEATSIFSFILSMNEFIRKNYMECVLNRDNTEQSKAQLRCIANEVNRINADINICIAHFIQFHYITDRNDSLFWQEFNSTNTLFDNTIAEIKNINDGQITEQQIGSINVFDRESWNVVGNGCGHCNPDNLQYNELYDIVSIKSSIDYYADKFIDHMDVIDYGRNSE